VVVVRSWYLVTDGFPRSCPTGGVLGLASGDGEETDWDEVQECQRGSGKLLTTLPIGLEIENKATRALRVAIG